MIDDYNSKLTTMQSYEKANEQPKIRVVIRKRPLNRKEIARGEQDVVEVAHSNEVIVREQKYTLPHLGPKSISQNTWKSIILSLIMHSQTLSPIKR